MNPPIVHRDLKPSNIIIDKYDNMILLDFNAAKQFNGVTNSDTVLIGTQGYAAPEQYGFGSSSPKTDIYSIGVILKELCDRNLTDNTFKNVVDSCMKISPDERYESVDDIVRELNGKMRDTISLKPIDFIPPGFRTKTPWKMVLAAMGYGIIIWSTTSVQTDPPSTGIYLFIERLSYVLCFFTIIAVACNYMDVLRFMPLCKSKNKVVYHLGKWILGFMIMCIVVIGTVLLQSPFK